MVQGTPSAVVSPTDSISISQVQSQVFEAGVSRNKDVNGITGVDEDERTPIERLGRERLPKFKSFTAEVCFCYSLLASMITVVSSFDPFPTWFVVQFLHLFLVGVFPQRLQCFSTHHTREARYTSGIPSLISKRLLARHSCLSLVLRST